MSKLLIIVLLVCLSTRTAFGTTVLVVRIGNVIYVGADTLGTISPDWMSGMDVEKLDTVEHIKVCKLIVSPRYAVGVFEWAGTIPILNSKKADQFLPDGRNHSRTLL